MNSITNKLMEDCISNILSEAIIAFNNDISKVNQWFNSDNLVLQHEKPMRLIWQFFEHGVGKNPEIYLKKILSNIKGSSNN